MAGLDANQAAIQNTKVRNNCDVVFSEQYTEEVQIASNGHEDDFVYSLISLVESNPVLWDPKRYDNRNKHKKDVAWIEISRHLPNKTAEECKAKWKSLRERYSRELKKNSLKESGAGDNRKIWGYMDAMNFIKHIVIPRSKGKVWRATSTFTPSSPLPAEAEVEMVSVVSPTNVFELSSSSQSACGDAVALNAVQSPKEKQPREKRYREIRPKDGTQKSVENYASTWNAHDTSINKRERRLDGLRNIIADRYVALHPRLQNEFDLKVQSLMNEYSLKNTSNII